MNILEEIVENKKREVFLKFGNYPRGELSRNENHQRTPLGFAEKLQKHKDIAVIAEIKKASPSKGVICERFVPEEIAGSYAEGGADCFSILTEEKYFLGSPEYLSNIRSRFEIPALRKDFMVDLRQVRESYEMGADAILLIVATLNDKQLADFKNLAEEFGLDCLVEVHTREELEIAEKGGFGLIGVNNRNLKTFETSIETSVSLSKHMPEAVKVSESGIKTPEHVTRLQEAGFDAILVGETFMRLENPGEGIGKIRPQQN